MFACFFHFLSLLFPCKHRNSHYPDAWLGREEEASIDIANPSFPCHQTETGLDTARGGRLSDTVIQPCFEFFY